MNLDRFRFDVDDAMARAQEMLGAESETDREAEQRRTRIRSTWSRIASDLEKDGPFAVMLANFRQDAVDALSELVHVDPNDSKQIAALQATVLRSMRTLEVVDEYQNASAAAETNTESEIVSVEE